MLRNSGFFPSFLEVDKTENACKSRLKGNGNRNNNAAKSRPSRSCTKKEKNRLIRSQGFFNLLQFTRGRRYFSSGATRSRNHYFLVIYHPILKTEKPQIARGVMTLGLVVSALFAKYF